MSWVAPTDADIDAAQTPGTGTAPVRADLTNTLLRTLRDGIAGVYTSAVQAIAGLTPAADTFAYFTSTGAALANITAFARGFLAAAADAATAQAYLGVTGGGGGGGAPAAHEATHLSGGTDALAGALDATARTSLWHNGSAVAARRALDLVEGSNVTLGFADDPTNEVVHVTVTAAGGGSLSLSDNTVLPRHLLGKTGNLFPDPKLETAFASVWTIVGPWSRVSVTTHPDCDWAAGVAGGSASDAYLRVFPSEVVPVRPGEVFYLSLDARLAAGGTTATSQMQVGMSFVGLGGAALGELTVGAVPTSSFVTVSGVITAPAGAKLANIFLKRAANTDTYAYRATELRCRRLVPPEELGSAGATGLAVLASATQAVARSATGAAPALAAFYQGASSANWLRSAHWTGSSTTATPVANTIYYSLFRLDVRYAPTKCAINVTAAVSGTCDVTFWLLDPATGKVGTKVFSATLSTTATGTIAATIAPGTLEPGRYVARLTFSAAPTVRGHQTCLCDAWGVDPTVSSSPTTAKTSAPGSFVTNPTAAEDVGTFADSTAAVPLLYLQ